MDVLFELADRLGAECVGDDLSLTGVFLSVSDVEEASADGDEGVVVLAGGLLVGVAKASSGQFTSS